jgi:NDP-sugar pyrophosphorylase family protein
MTRNARRRALRRRALVLAAGHGTRLRPLTEQLPKPLLPVLGRTLLERTLAALAGVGCEAVAINLHHLADAIPAALGDRYEGVPLHYSHEREILGTGGAFVPLRGFFAGCGEVLLVNGDSLCDWPLEGLLARHRHTGAAATLLLAGRPDPRPFGGGIGIDRRGKVTAIRRDRAFGDVARRHVYAGAYVLRPELIARLPEGPSDSMNDLFLPLLAEGGGPLAALVTWRRWHDLGTPARSLDGVRDWARLETRRDTWVSPSARVAPTARLRGSVVEAGARVGSGAGLRHALVMPGATVGAGCDLSGVIVGPGVELPPGTTLAGQLATRAGDGPGAGGAPAEVRLTPLGAAAGS